MPASSKGDTVGDNLHAPAPSRPTATFTVMLGMVPVPIRLFTPTEETELVKRKLFTQEGHPVGMPTTDMVTGEKVSRDQCKKMVDVDGEFVELTDDEIAQVTAGQAVDKGCVNIETFIPLETIGERYRVSKWYQARPQEREIGSGKKKKRQPNPVADKAFVLLLAALKAENVAALVRVGLRSTARYAALTPDGHFHFLHYDGEVREERELPEADVSDAELDMARQLLTNVGVSTPDLFDEAGEAVFAYVTKKAAGDVSEFEVIAAPEVDNVIDFTALLTTAVAQAKAS